MKKTQTVSVRIHKKTRDTLKVIAIKKQKTFIDLIEEIVTRYKKGK